MSDSNKEQVGIRATVAELTAIGRSISQQGLGAQKLSRTFLSGQYASHFRGRGMDYLETRPYANGDDIRNIDWRVTARIGSPHSKLFVEERDRPIVILGDFSASTYFGSRTAFKSVVAARIGAAMAFSGVKRGDRIGCLIHGQNGKFDIRPKGGRSNLMRVIHALSQATLSTDNQQGQSTTKDDKSLGDLLIKACRSVPTGSMVILLSDFYDQASTYKKSLFHLAQHADIIGFHLYDTLEVKLPIKQAVSLSDGTRRIRISTDKIGQSRQENHFIEHRKQLKTMFEKMGQALIHVSTQDDLLSILRCRELTHHARAQRTRLPNAVS